MSWFLGLGIAAALIGLAALFAAQPKEGRPVGHTRLMTVARVILVVIAVFIVAWFALR